MRARRLLAMLAFGLSLTVWGASGSSPSVAELEKEAQKLSSQAKFREAAESLKKAIEIEPKPRFYYQLAKALDQAGESSEALEYYRKYTASSETQAKLLKQAKDSIKRLEEDVKKEPQEAERRPPGEEVRAAKVQVEEGARIGALPIKGWIEVAGEEAARIEAARQRAEAQRDLDNWRFRRIGAVPLGGLSVAAVIVGGVLGVQALGARSAFNEAGTRQEKDSLKTAIQQGAFSADLCVGGGLVLAVVAAAVFPWSPEPAVPEKEAWEERAPKVSLSVGPGAAALEVRF